MNRITTMKKQVGIGLIEVMISVVLGLSIMAGILQVFSVSLTNTVASESTSRIINTVQYAFAIMGNDIANAGNLGCSNTSDNKDGEFITNRLALKSSSNQYYDFSRIAGGIDNVSSDPVITSNTDTFSIRFFNTASRIDYLSHDATSVTVDSSDSDYASLEQYQVVLLANCTLGLMFMITNDPTSSSGAIEFATSVTAPAGSINEGQSNTSANNAGELSFFGANNGSSNTDSPTYLYTGETGAFQYYIGTSVNASGTCSISSNPQNCSLFRINNGVTEELVEGVHNMQIEYGFLDDPSLASPKTLYKTPANLTETWWPDVDRVKITLSFNSVQRSATSTNPITMDVTRVFHLPNQL